MHRHMKRRTILRRGVASTAAVLLGAQGSTAFAQTGGSEATPLSGTGQEDAQVASQTSEQLTALWERWVELWNGDLAIAGEIVAPGFVAHFAPAGNSPTDVRGPEGLTDWIGQIMAPLADYRLTTTEGPLADDDMLAGRWVMRGTYQGGIPGSAPEAIGAQIAYEGMDLLRVDDGHIVEYWLSADILYFLQQLGVIPS